MIQETVYTVVTGNGNFEALASNRLYPMRLPQDAVLPAAAYQVISNTPVNSLDGDSNLDQVRLQITCWAATYAAVAELAAVVRNAIVTSASFKAVTENILDTEDPDTKGYGIILDFSIWAEVEAITPVDLEYLLLETGDFMLLETGDKLALEV